MATPEISRQRLEPHECEQCDCQRFRWNGLSSSLRSDPPTTCMCGHVVARHRFREATDG